MEGIIIEIKEEVNLDSDSKVFVVIRKDAGRRFVILDNGSLALRFDAAVYLVAETEGEPARL